MVNFSGFQAELFAFYAQANIIESRRLKTGRHKMIHRGFLKATLLTILAPSVVALAAFPQSGRSWMNGFVFDKSDTRGLADATVELIGDPASERLRSVKLTTKTDSNGKYAFKDVPYGDYAFRVSAPGFTGYQINLYIASDALTELHVKLRKQE